MTSKDRDSTPKAAGGRCPVCGKPTVAAVRPFCSKRCADIDLGRWLSGSYVIGGGSPDADEDGLDRAVEDAGKAIRRRNGTEPGGED